MIAEFFLRPDLVFLGTPLVTVGDGRQGAGAQTLHFKGQPVAAAVVLLYHCDLRHTVSGQPIIHRADELIGVGLFAACVGKQDQVNGNFVLVKSNKDGGAVRAAAKGYDIDRFTSNSSYNFLVPIHQSVTSDNAAVQGITLDLAGVSAVALHGVDVRAVCADHDAHMVGVAAVVPIEENCVAGGDVAVPPVGPLAP